jgi:hypothetical protein
MKKINERIFKTAMVMITGMFIVSHAQAQVTSTARIGQQAFEILKSMSTTSQQQYHGKFSKAISVIGSANAPVDFYNEMYDLIINSGINFRNIKFIEFNECPSSIMRKENGISSCNASTLVFEYQERKYYIKVAYFYYNNQYYLLGFRDRGIKQYPF